LAREETTACGIGARFTGLATQSETCKRVEKEKSVILLNFAHPITDEQLEQIERELNLDVTGENIIVLDVRCQFDDDKPFAEQVEALEIDEPLAEQVEALVDSAGITEWQTLPLLVNLPALSSAAALVLAEIHGRCGYYPSCIRLKKADRLPTRYVLAEILDVDAMRQRARQKRS